ncbi:MAG: hypothetical protein OEQ53_02910 [Saprospiraceae bacterium]|nr:hypothetical protein [Saprospiraceae bacterium]
MDPEVRIVNPIDTLALGSNYEFLYRYFDQTGLETELPGGIWSSDNPSAISITTDGFATGVSIGSALISVQIQSENGSDVRAEHLVHVGATTSSTNTLRKGSLRSTSSYKLQGDFTAEQMGSMVILSFEANYEASSSLPGLYAYLTNNPNSVNNAFEIGAVEIFKGAHTYEIENISLNDYSHLLYYCKPFRVKVGDGELE